MSRSTLDDLLFSHPTSMPPTLPTPSGFNVGGGLSLMSVFFFGVKSTTPASSNARICRFIRTSMLCSVVRNESVAARYASFWAAGSTDGLDDGDDAVSRDVVRALSEVDVCSMSWTMLA